jgi:hypothetical protein
MVRDLRKLAGVPRPRQSDGAYHLLAVPSPRSGERLMADGYAPVLAQQSDRPTASLAARAHGQRAGASATSAQRLAVPGWAVFCAALSPVLLTAGWLIAGVFQPASYSPVRQTVSVLAGHAGTDSWIMTWAMLLTGGCYLLTAAGLNGLWVPARFLLVLAGLCSLGIATSPEPVTGPTPVHLAWTTVGAATIAIWPAVAARRAPPQLAAVCGRTAFIVTAVFAAMLGWVLLEIWAGHDLGLAERLTASIQTTWPFAVALVWRRADGTGTTPQLSAARQPLDVGVPATGASAGYGSLR